MTTKRKTEALITGNELDELADRFWQTKSDADRHILILRSVAALSQWNRRKIGADIDRENYADELGIEIDRSLPGYTGDSPLAQWTPTRGSYSKWLWTRNQSRLVNYYSAATKAMEVAQEAALLESIYGGKLASSAGHGRDGQGYSGRGRGPRSFTWNMASERAFAVRGPAWPTPLQLQRWKDGVRKGIPKLLRCTSPICFGRAKGQRGGHLFIAGTNLRGAYEALCPDCWSGKHEMEDRLNKVLSDKADIEAIPAPIKPEPVVKLKKTRTNRYTMLRLNRTA